MQIVVDILNSILFDAAILSLVTMGIVLIFRTSITTNFAQGTIATFSAYTVTAIVDLVFRAYLPNMPMALILILSMIIGIITASLIGLFIDVVLIRHSRFTNPIAKQMITMGVIMLLTGLQTVIFTQLGMETRTPQFFTDSLGTHKIISYVLTIVVIGTIFVMLKFTKWGIGVRATASNEKVASMMGVNTKRITLTSWAIASALGALAAALYAPTIFTLSPNMMVGMQVNGFLAEVLGGFTSFGGPIIAAVLMTSARVIATKLLFGVPVVILGSQIDVWVPAFVYLVLFIVILFKPLGLFGKKIVKKV
ncbi:branched-chain amino acid ABC transporter permease [Acholeplasma laidlawii]|uniref:branched-chain amino acid ABC transporter permease n=1 Tax=Acholeplasma laidlawii TaxID=2148 RepID=UPI000B9910C5|nr:branched-chain amino acid ABC transporter permease [Acholeplasma laidlawii]PII02373.1 branched-chain amino acid ABC transporter permease [Acholeplasma laidlawii]